MASIIAPPSLFSAHAFANWEQLGTPPDPDLLPGTHVRINAGLGASVPISPFFLFPVRSSSADLTATIRDRAGDEVPDLDPLSYGPLDATLLHNEHQQRPVRVDVITPDDAPTHMYLLDQHDRLIAHRDRGPWMFAAPVLHKLFVAGDTSASTIQSRIVHEENLAGLEAQDLLATFGLPVPGPHFWYIGIHTEDDARFRVEDGAPQRTNPMDAPDGPFISLGGADELQRVDEMLTASELGGGVVNVVATMVDDPTPPWLQEDVHQLPDRGSQSQFATFGRQATLQMSARDPGVARYFGFGGRTDFVPDLENGEAPDTVAVVALFALDPKGFERMLIDFTGLEQAPWADRLLDLIVHSVAMQTGQGVDEVANQIQEMTDRIRDQGFIVAPFATFAAAVPLWLPPDLPDPDEFDSHWQAPEDGQASQRYRSSFAFPSPSLMSLSALGRDDGWGMTTRHEFLPGGRAVPGVFSHGYPQLAPPRLPESSGILSDHDIDANPGVATFQACASDFFGRFGQPVRFDSYPPPRPLPPEPVLRYHLEPADIDLDANGMLSPGTLVVTVATPAAWPGDRFVGDELNRLGSTVVVPRIDDLAAGAYPLIELHLELAGNGQVAPVAVPGFARYEFALPPLAPQARSEWELRGWYQDAIGQGSGIAVVRVVVTDCRPPKVYPSGIGVYWTSAPGPSPDVEVRLKWPAPAGSRHRVYLTDEDGIGVAANGQDERSRGLVGALGCKRIQDGIAIGPERFSQLTEIPVIAGGDGWAVLNARLPRTLATVQFLRVVPLGPDGAEPDFATCGIVPVAVPELRHPVAPLASGTVDPATGAADITVSTDGLSKSLLQRDEPGLFDPDQEGAALPQYSIRRAMGPVSDPLYAQVVTTGDLALQDSEGNVVTFADTWRDNRGLVPFVRYAYWAEVRMPPERRLPADWIPLDPAGGVTTVDPAGKAPCPRPFSPPSAPCVLMSMPPDPPAAPAESTIAITRDTVTGLVGTDIRITFQIVNPPSAHAKAIDRYRLALWTQAGTGPIERVTVWNSQPATDEWPPLTADPVTILVTPPSIVDLETTVTLRFAFVDPAGRTGEMLVVSVPSS